jgi:hypothetical protein
MNAKLAQVRQVLEDIDFNVTGILGAANHPRVAAIRALVRRGINEIDDDRGPRVHLLKQGVALCGFGAGGVPGEWPPGHNWIGINDPNPMRVVSCEGCRSAWKTKEQGI